MTEGVTLDPVLVRFREQVRALYGSRLDRLVLFGSRARGDFHEDSDYDVAVFLHDMGRLWDELGTLCNLTVPFLLEDVFISAKPFARERYWDDSSLMRNVRQEGVEL